MSSLDNLYKIREDVQPIDPTDEEEREIPEEQRILLDYVNDDVRSYWREYDRWVKGKRNDKPDVNDSIAEYWKVQSKLRYERRSRENRELHEYLDMVHAHYREPRHDMEVWGTADLANYYRRSRSTISDWIKRGWITGYKTSWPNGHWRVNREDIEDIEDDAKKMQIDIRGYLPRIVHNAKEHRGRQ